MAPGMAKPSPPTTATVPRLMAGHAQERFHAASTAMTPTPAPIRAPKPLERERWAICTLLISENWKVRSLLWVQMSLPAVPLCRSQVALPELRLDVDEGPDRDGLDVLPVGAGCGHGRQLLAGQAP